jgi:hypothetical protein
MLRYRKDAPFPLTDGPAAPGGGPAGVPRRLVHKLA